MCSLAIEYSVVNYISSLDSIGGPNHLGNMCDSPVLAVPHRALGARKDFPAQLGFEHAGHPFGDVHGDNKTREELNAEGSPAQFLDVGVVGSGLVLS